MARQTRKKAEPEETVYFNAFKDGYFAGMTAIAEHIEREKSRIEKEHAALTLSPPAKPRKRL